MANSVKINVDVVTNITGQDDVKKLQDSLNALTAANNSRVKSEKAESAAKQRSIIQIAEEIAAENKKRQIQIDAHNASIAAYIKEASSLSNITRLSQHKASIELAAAKQEKSIADETQKAQKYAYNFTAIEVKMGIDGAKARAKAEKEAAAARAKAEKEAAAEAEKASKAKIKAEKEAAKEAEKANKAEIKANNEKIKQEQQLKKVSEQRLDSAASSASSLVQKTQSSFSRIKDIALGALTALGLDELFGNIGEQLSTATSNASSIVESENLLRATYNEGADALLNWADKNAEAYGLANASAKQYLSFLTGVLNNTDISSDKLGSMAQNYTRLVGDMASAYNTEIDDAFQAIRSGIAGNTLAMQRYGIVLSVTNLQQYLQSKGIEANYRSLDAASKQYVRYAYIMEHTAEVQGDYTRTFESFANSVKTLKNEWNNFLSLLGQYAIPVLMPIINALRTAIAYAGEVLKYLASIYGWEQYTTIAVDYSYQQVENIEDAVDSQEDLTAEVKNTNKALKSGVKLLDLYSLDFSDASSASSAGTTPEKSPVSAQIEDLANIDYNVPDKLLPDIDVDLNKVKEIGDELSAVFNLIKGVWDVILVPFLVSPIYRFLDNDLPGKVNTIVNLIGGYVTATLLAPIAAKFFVNLFKNMPLGLKQVLGTTGGLIISAMGGWKLGESLAATITYGEPDVLGAVSGLLTAVGGIVLAFTTGGPVAGVVAILGTLFFTFVGALEEADAQIEKAVGNALSGTKTMKDYLLELDEVKAIENLATQAESVRTTMSNLDQTTENLWGTMSSLDTTASQEDLDALSTSCDNLVKEMETAHDQAEIQLSDLFAESLSATGDAADGAVESLKEYAQAQYNLAFSDEETATKLYQGLKLRALSGEELTEEEKARLSTLETILSSSSGVESKLSKIDFSDLNFGSMGEAQDWAYEEIDKYSSSLDTLRSVQQDIINQAKTFKESDLGLHSDEYYDAQIKAAEEQLALLDANEKLFTSGLAQKLNEYYDGAFDELTTDRLPALAKAYQDDLYVAIGNIFGGGGDASELIDSGVAEQLAKAIVGPDSSFEEYLQENLGYSLKDAANAVKDGSGYLEIIENAFAASTITGEFTLRGEVYNSKGENITDNMEAALSAMIPDLVDKLPEASKARRQKVMREAADASGFSYETYTKDGIEFYRFTNNIDFVSVFNVDDNADTIYKSALDSYSTASANFEKIAASEVAPAFVDPVLDSETNEFNSESNKAKITNAVEEGFTASLENVKTPEEAKKKGSDLAEAITSGVTNGFNTALAPGSEFMKAADNLTNTLVNIPTKFESAFKSAVNNIAGYINSLVNGLKQQLEGLNLPEGDLTVAQLYSSLKDSNFKIPMLANGGVIPANNPFLAVLGDQKSGVNIEAPVTVIQDAVRNVVNDTGTSDNIEVKVYIGDREIRDFVIDTVTANNLVVG